MFILVLNSKYPNDRIQLKVKNTFNLLYKTDKKFFLNIDNIHINNNNGLGYHHARVPVAEYIYSFNTNPFIYPKCNIKMKI